MKTRYAVGLAMLVGFGMGAVAVQGLHAQSKPRAYIVTETEVIDAAALAAYSPKAQAALKAAGGRSVAPASTKAVALVGEAPKRVGISEWESLEKAQAWRNSAAWKELSPERDKAIKPVRAYVIEGAPN
jgi:uncharacterized protein (DUF1330 family)